jgi:hypothetical protein
MGLLSTIRKMWRRHDEKLAEHEYHELYEHEPSAVAVPDVPEPYGPAGAIMTAQRRGEVLLADAVRNEDALEHEEPTPEEAASNELGNNEERN